MAVLSKQIVFLQALSRLGGRVLPGKCYELEVVDTAGTARVKVGAQTNNYVVFGHMNRSANEIAFSDGADLLLFLSHPSVVLI